MVSSELLLSLWKYRFNHGLQRCKYKRTKVVSGSSRFRACYSSQNDDTVFPLRPSPILLTHSLPSCPNFRVLPSTIYFLLSTLLLKCCLLPFFFNLKLSKFIVMVSLAMFFYLYFPPSHPHLGLIWKDLKDVLILTLLHVALAYLLIWGKQDAFPFFKKSQLTQQNTPKYRSFCISFSLSF